MKANAPEKIYIHPDIGGIEFIRPWLIRRASQESVEYTRTDAFIEKACEFFEENIKEEDCKFGSSEWTELRAEYKSLDSFIKAFVEYMKGE